MRDTILEEIANLENVNFLGHKFIRYVDVGKVKEALKLEKDRLNISQIEIIEDVNSTIQDLYKMIYPNLKLPEKKCFDNIIFENIFYGKQKHIYVEYFDLKTGDIMDDEFVKNNIFATLNTINTKDSNNGIDFQLRKQILPEGFDLIKYLDINHIGVEFVSNLKIDKDDDENIKKIRILYGKTVTNKKKGKDDPRKMYMLAGIEIDIEKKRIVTLIRNEANIDNGFTLTGMYQSILSKIISKINLIIKKRNEKMEKELMYSYCMRLNETICEKHQLVVESECSQHIKDFVSDTLNNDLKIEEKVNSGEREEILDKIQSIFLGKYLKVSNDDGFLRQDIFNANLKGYPTDITFKGVANSGKGRAQSSDKYIPLVTSGLYHSLSSEMRMAQDLTKWRMAWFEHSIYSKDKIDSEKVKMKDLEVIQSTIEITKKYFHITILTQKHLDREAIYFVIDELLGEYSG